MSGKSDRRHKPKPAPQAKSGVSPSGRKAAGRTNHPHSNNPPKNSAANQLANRTGTPWFNDRRASGARHWLARLLLLFLTPVGVLLLGEGILRLCGYGYPVSFFVKSDSNNYVTNEKFAWQFFSKHTALKPFLYTLPGQKAPGTLRVCILGESAAMGTPDPAFSFGRILEAMLRRQYPQTRFEIMNGAMRGINSHVIRLIAQEGARHQVDLFIIYMGNNEVVGLHAPSPGSPPWAQSLTLIRAGQWVRRTRLGEFLSAALHSATEPAGQNMQEFRNYRLGADDWRREKIRQNFRANLQDILEAATDSGAKVILCTVAVNLKDLPPFGSLHRPGLGPADTARWDSLCDSGTQLENKGEFHQAIERYLAATQLDDHFAELHFRLGRCYWALQEWGQARQHFVLARDWDALQFRTDSPMNQILRDAAASYQSTGVRLLDIEKVFAESGLSEHGLPGQQLFYEHVHPTFAGNYLLARACDHALVAQLGVRLPAKASAEIPSPRDCAADIAYTTYDDVNVNAAMVRLTAEPPFLDQLDHSQRQAAAEAENRSRLAAFGPQEAQLCLNSYLDAMSRRPDDWPIRFNMALFCQDLKRDEQAVEQFQYLVRRFPQIKNFRIGLANSLLNTENRAGALAQLQAALRLDPDNKELQSQVAQLSKKSAAP